MQITINWYTSFQKICKAFSNGSSANIKFSKTRLSTMIQSGGIIGDLLVGIPTAMLLAGKETLKKKV